MKKLGILGLVCLLGLIVASGAWSQAGRGQGAGWGPGDPYNRMYQPATVETVSGEITGVDKFTPGRGMSYGVHFTLKTDKETIPVHLGPSWYMEKQAVTIAPGDKVEVTGSRITYQDKPTIIGGELKKRGEGLEMRGAA